MWMQNGELIDGAQNLLSQGNGQATTAATPKTVFTAKEGKRPSILLDFGREIHGGLQFVTCIRASTKPVKVRVRLGESVGEAMCNITPENGATNDHAMRDYTIELPWLGVCEVGNSGFRFVRIGSRMTSSCLSRRYVRAFSIATFPTWARSARAIRAWTASG